MCENLASIIYILCLLLLSSIVINVFLYLSLFKAIKVSTEHLSKLTKFSTDALIEFLKLSK